MSAEILIRPACPADRDELRAMQAQSFRELGAVWYDPKVIEAFISTIGTMDDSLLEQGTYYAAVAQGTIIGSGGWSDRTPGYAAHRLRVADVPLAPKAVVRSVFVHPKWARRGVARAVMAVIESDIAAAGLATASLTATLSGVPLYRRLGYGPGAPVALGLPDGLTFVGVAMSKDLTCERPIMHAA